MSLVAAVVLIVLACVATFPIFVNPAGKWGKKLAGLSRKEVSEVIDREWDRNPAGIIGVGCGCCQWIVIGAIYTFVVEPAVVLWAISNHYGSQIVAGVVLFVILISWVRTIFAFRDMVVLSMASQLEHMELVLEERAPSVPYQLWFGAKSVFFAIPVMYLWYLGMVGIGFLK